MCREGQAEIGPDKDGERQGLAIRPGEKTRSQLLVDSSITNELPVIQNTVFLFGTNVIMAKLFTRKFKHLKGELGEH